MTIKPHRLGATPDIAETQHIFDFNEISKDSHHNLFHQKLIRYHAPQHHFLIS